MAWRSTKTWPEVHLRGLIPPDPSHVARLGICAWRWGGIAQPVGECSLWDLYKVISHWVTGAAKSQKHGITWKPDCRETDPWLDVYLWSIYSWNHFFFCEVEFQSPGIQCAKGQTSGTKTRSRSKAKKWSSTTSEDLLIPTQSVFFGLPQGTADEQTFRQNLGCPKDSKSMIVWQRFRKSASPGFTAGSSITWTKWLKKLGLSYGIFLWTKCLTYLPHRWTLVGWSWMIPPFFMSFLYVIDS